MLNVLTGLGEEHGMLAEVAAEHAALIRRPERTRQQPTGREALEPLAVLHVTCGPALDVLDLLWVDQEHLEATGLKQLKEGDPIDPSGFHRDRGDSTRASQGTPPRG